MGNDTIPYEDSGYVRSNNWGAQLNFSVPLDGGMIELCKSIAKKHEEKMRLDYELVRALKCTEIMKAGFMFRPGSRVEVCLLYTSPSPRDLSTSRMPSSA